MGVNGDDIRAVYELAALAAAEGEPTAMRSHFEKMFRHLEDLTRVPVEGVEPYFTLPQRDLPLAADRVAAPEDGAAIRGSFAQEAEGFLVVPRVVNRGGAAEKDEE